MKSSLLALLPLVATALGASRTSPPSGCLSVANSGGQYTTIQAAVNALSTTSTAAQCIFIGAGTYTEQVLVPARSAKLTIYGYTADTSSYAGNKAIITSSKSQANGLSNDETATLRVKAANFKLYNVNVNNGYGKGSQAVALSAYADSGYYACSFTGYQDTLLAQQGNQLYSKCLIQGATDFIFGQHAPAWFDKCDIRVLASSVGYVTASGRPSSSDANYYVFNGCTIAAASGNTVTKGAYYLGRPWAAYARVVVQKTSMTSVINSAGWRIWNTGDERTSNVVFGDAVSIATVLGSGYASAGWYDGAYM
ncbi:family 8 carbohydrate esterase [Bombardia bombarda]|uniref:Pectinesterase n=1 Tax=Bombardia bombarda TaxID=252184 RepID=A0AA39X8F7_9PEZI|nr:family 8 carbohydrate esterase [Bombardia bombarda]